VTKALLSLKHTPTRRTSGHCLGTFKTGEKMYLAPLPFKCSVSRYVPHFLPSLSLCFNKGSIAKKKTLVMSFKRLAAKTN
jgi:hypothetical protein